MTRPKKSECTEEQWAYYTWRIAAERSLETHLEKAVALAVAVYGPDVDYARLGVNIRLGELWKEQGYEPKKRRMVKTAIAKSLRKRVFERDGYRCVICGDWHELHVDHIHPESLGGETTFENLQTLCRSCNCRKGAQV